MRFFVLFLLAFAGCSSPKVINGVPNLAQVGPGIWRGGQPTAAGWTNLAAMGVTNVVKLNPAESDAIATSLGMTVHEFPINAFHQIFGPVEPQLRGALKLVVPGTFAHCEHGEHRAGTLFILYRMEHDHWTKSNAVAEANSLGWATSFPALKHFVEELK